MANAAPNAARPKCWNDLLDLTAVAQHPDAVLLSAIERYLHLRDLHRYGAERGPRATPAVAGEGVQEMDALEAEIGRLPACTALGARAKLELALDLMPKGGTAYAIPASALRDFLAAMDAENAAGSSRAG